MRRWRIFFPSTCSLGLVWTRVFPQHPRPAQAHALHQLTENPHYLSGRVELHHAQLDRHKVGGTRYAKTNILLTFSLNIYFLFFKDIFQSIKKVIIWSQTVLLNLIIVFLLA